MIFDPVTLSAGFMLAKLGACPHPRPVEVNITMTHNEQPYDTSLSGHGLTAFHNDPDSTSFTDGKWMVVGLNKSNIETRYRVNFDGHANTKTKEVCSTIARVDYEIIYTNTIYIASDFANMGCKYGATMIHEKKHVLVDIRTITDFIPYIKQTIQKAANSVGSIGPYPAATTLSERQRITNEFGAILAPLTTEMINIRRERQAEVDTIENYKRDSALCPGQFPDFDGSPKQ